jgi:hypothetical protein
MTDLACNKKFLTDIKVLTNTMHVATNGMLSTNNKGSWPSYQNRIWYSRSTITNIIALKNVKKQYRVTYDSNDEYFMVHRGSEGKPNILFHMNPCGLHYFDPKDQDFMFVSTVTENKKEFTKQQIQCAKVARSLYRKLGFLSMKDYKYVIQMHQIKDCPVMVANINVAFKIWGKDVAMLKGKMVKKKPIPVVRDLVKVPKEFIKLHKDMTLTMDIFFVNGIAFVLLLSRIIYFTRVSHLAARKADSILKAFKEIYVFYLHRGFRIQIVLADGEYQPLKPLIEALPYGTRVNLLAKSEHVADIERLIGVVKERARAVRHAMPYSRIPRLLVIYLVFQSIHMLNYFPTKVGVSAALSPMTIMSGETLDYKKQLRLQIGQYCQVHEEDAPRNSQNPRTKGAIVLGPTGNNQGGYYFMALSTGKKITCYSWDEIPTPDTVIDQVNKLGRDQPEQLTFTDHHGNWIGDNETPGVVPEYPLTLADEEQDKHNYVKIPGVEDDVGIPGVDAGTEQGTQDPQSSRLIIPTISKLIHPISNQMQMCSQTTIHLFSKMRQQPYLQRQQQYLLRHRSLLQLMNNQFNPL